MAVKKSSIMVKKDLKKGSETMERDPEEMKKSSTDKKEKAKSKTVYRDPEDKNKKKWPEPKGKF
jgi:hypothetical protein